MSRAIGLPHWGIALAIAIGLHAVALTWSPWSPVGAGREAAAGLGGDRAGGHGGIRLRLSHASGTGELRSPGSAAMDPIAEPTPPPPSPEPARSVAALATKEPAERSARPPELERANATVEANETTGAATDSVANAPPSDPHGLQSGGAAGEAFGGSPSDAGVPGAAGDRGNGSSGSAGSAACLAYEDEMVRRILAAPYPRRLLRRGIEGTVAMRVAVDSGGELLGAERIGSSGSAGLDRDAGERVRRAAPFPANTERCGPFELDIVYDFELAR